MDAPAKNGAVAAASGASDRPDGLIDLLGGLAVLSTGIGWACGLGGLAASWIPLWVVLRAPLHRRFVEPRLRHAGGGAPPPGAAGLAWAAVLGAGLLALAVVALLLVRRGPVPAFLARVDAGLPAVLVAVGAVVAAALTGERRFGAYGVFLCGAATATVLLDGGPALPLVAGGLFAAASGAVLFVRFLRGAGGRENS